MADPQRYPLPAAQVQVEDEIQRSRFITTLAPADSVAAAKGFIAGIAAERAGATHNCFAYLVGPPGTSARIGMSDDGEPHGTAGRPMLNILLHCDAGDLAVVVTRYFGGIKLGKGGLVRAYSGGVQHALREVVLVERIIWRQVSLIFDYNLLEPLKRLYPDYEVEILTEEFTASIQHLVRLPVERLDEFRAAVGDRTGGRIEIDETPLEPR